jgi:bifunctional DNA-binding transcriptional regulator/antitoxin component of YhaV-PrlF toxin-antitoxin module
MKILKEKSRTYKGQAYYKYKVNLPEVLLARCNLKEGDELEVIPGDKSVILKKIER